MKLSQSTILSLYVVNYLLHGRVLHQMEMSLTLLFTNHWKQVTLTSPQLKSHMFQARVLMSRYEYLPPFFSHFTFYLLLLFKKGLYCSLLIFWREFKTDNFPERFQKQSLQTLLADSFPSIFTNKNTVQHIDTIFKSFTFWLYRKLSHLSPEKEVSWMKLTSTENTLPIS